MENLISYHNLSRVTLTKYRNIESSYVVAEIKAFKNSASGCCHIQFALNVYAFDLHQVRTESILFVLLLPANKVAGRSCFQRSVCLSVHGGGPHVTITHDALVVTVQGTGHQTSDPPVQTPPLLVTSGRNSLFK